MQKITDRVMVLFEPFSRKFLWTLRRKSKIFRTIFLKIKNHPILTILRKHFVEWMKVLLRNNLYMLSRNLTVTRKSALKQKNNKTIDHFQENS